jgi:hypothetical protein
MPITWNKAYKFCHAINQTLLTISSQESMDALRYFLTRKPWSTVKYVINMTLEVLVQNNY